MNENYLVVLKKRGAKSSDRFFVVTQIRRDEFISPAVFHGIGFWTDKNIKTQIRRDEVEKQTVEVWIPWNEIDHVESLMYRQRS